MGTLRLARRITNLLLLGAVVGAVVWQAASRGPEIIAYWQDVARVRRAERALDRGDRWLALQMLGQAGKPGTGAWHRFGHRAVYLENITMVLLADYR